MPERSYSLLTEAAESFGEVDLSIADELPAGEKLRELAQVLNESVDRLEDRAHRVILIIGSAPGHLSGSLDAYGIKTLCIDPIIHTSGLQSLSWGWSGRRGRSWKIINWHDQLNISRSACGAVGSSSLRQGGALLMKVKGRTIQVSEVL